MTLSYINTAEDMDWLFEVHLKGRSDRKQFHSAEITGNEDCPKEVRLYEKQEPLFNDPFVLVIYNYKQTNSTKLIPFSQYYNPENFM